MTFNNTTLSNELYTIATGATSSNPFVVIFQTRDPTISDIQYPIQKIWLNTTSQTFWFLKNFNSSQGVTTANWITLSASSQIDEILVDTFTAPGTNPVIPNTSGQITVTGGQIPAQSTPNVIRTDSLAPNTYTIEIQRSTASTASVIGNNGVSSFDSASFTVDTNGFVQLAAGVGRFIWTDISGAFSPLNGNGYFITNTATATLPASPSQGDTIKFFVDSSTGVLTIEASGVQIIRIGSLASSGAGFARSTLQGDSLELVYRTADTCWCSIAGNTGTWMLM